MSPLKTGDCYVLIRDRLFLDCGRSFVEGKPGTRTVPFRTCGRCLSEFRELAALAKDRRAAREEWEGG